MPYRMTNGRPNMSITIDDMSSRFWRHFCVTFLYSNLFHPWTDEPIPTGTAIPTSDSSSQPILRGDPWAKFDFLETGPWWAFRDGHHWLKQKADGQQMVNRWSTRLMPHLGWDFWLEVSNAISGHINLSVTISWYHCQPYVNHKAQRRWGLQPTASLTPNHP